MNDLIFLGGSVKALGDGKVAGYLIQYSTADNPDLSAERDFFTAQCEYDLDTGNRKSVFYSHGLDAKMGVKRIGIGEVKQDDVGVWIESQLNIRDEYEKAIYKMAEEGKLGWSSGAPSHLVTRKAVKTEKGTAHEILSWPIAEASLTPCPADHRNQAIAFKSLGAMIGIQAGAEDHTTKALPGGMSYSDLMAFLNDELNEDLGGGRPPYDSGYLYICDLYDDAVIYRDGEDLYRVPFTVTAGNDAQWGTPEPVVRTTVYQTATDGDDMTMKSQADVTAIKQMLARSMTFGDHADVATSAMEGFVARAEGLADTATKAGRMISAANRDKMRSIHQGMRVAHDAMAAHMGKMGDLLAATDPDAKNAADDLEALRTEFVRLQSRQVQLTA